MSSSTTQQFYHLAARLQITSQVLMMYPPGHPEVERTFHDCYSAVTDILEERTEFKIAIAGREIVLGNIQIPARDDILREFAVTLTRADIERLILHRGIREEELRTFLALLATDARALADSGGIEQMLKDAGVEHIHAGVIKVGSVSKHSDALFKTWEAYSSGLKAVRNLRLHVREHGELIDIGEYRKFASDLVGLASLEKGPFLAVHALKAHDDYSFTHSVNVAMLTVGLSQFLPFSEENLHDIGVAALLHDIGKERIPKEIINKPGKLTPQEWEVMSKHHVEGVRMLAAAPDVPDLALIVAYEHHLGAQTDLPDHDGWPPYLASQLVSLADVYDALRSVRPYSDAIPPDEAMEIMKKHRGSKFDPDLFDGFSRTLGYYPPGTCVRLESGEICVVQAVNPDHLKRPRVVVVRGADERPLASPEVLDLVAAASEIPTPPAIAEVVDGTLVGVNPLNYM